MDIVSISKLRRILGLPNNRYDIIKLLASITALFINKKFVSFQWLLGLEYRGF